MSMSFDSKYDMSSSKSTNKKEKKSYTQEVLKKALCDIRDKKKSVRQICQEYGIPKTTILDKISGRRPDGVKKPGPEPVLGSDCEGKLVQWLLNISKCGFPIKKQELFDTVQKMIRDGKFKNKFKDDRPGQKWFDKFLARNKEIAVKNTESINKARGQATEESIRQWFIGLEEYLDSINQKDVLSDPTRIFNIDESGFALCPKTGKILGPRRYKNLYQLKVNNEKENITVLLTFNANGDVCPSCVVFPYIRPPKAVVNSMPQEWCLGKSETGLMSAEVFFEYITNEFNNWLEKHEIKKPVLLLVDGHKSHMSLMLSMICEQMKIILYALPPNTAHILHPAEVSVFTPLKTYWKTVVQDFFSKLKNFNSSVTKTNFCKLLNDALRHPNMSDNIKNGFNCCGLYPFNANSPDYAKCVMNTLEDVHSTHTANHSQIISHADIKTFKKVLQHLKPTLKEKNVNLRAITTAVNNLKKSLSVEVGLAEILIETESKTTQMDHSLEWNSTLFSPIKSELYTSTLSSLQEKSSNLNLQIQTVSPEIPSTTEKSIKPCPSKISTSYINIPPFDIDFDKVKVHLDKDNTRNVSSADTSISKLHISGSQLNVNSVASLDNLINSSEDMSAATVSAMNYENKEHIKSKEQDTIYKEDTKKRKLERVEKQTQKKVLKETQKLHKTDLKQNKEINVITITPDILHVNLIEKPPLCTPSIPSKCDV